jgi:hypothetical protein
MCAKILMVLRFELGLMLSRCYNTWAVPETFFFPCFFKVTYTDRVVCFLCGGQPQTMILLPMPSQQSWDCTYAPPHLAWVSLTFCPGWPWTIILPVSASAVLGITGMQHPIWLLHISILIVFTCICCLFNFLILKILS